LALLFLLKGIEMAKPIFNVEQIKKEANITLRGYYRQRGDRRAKSLQIRQIRLYAKKVLFLCKQIEKLQKKKL